ncbi:MAG: site-specific DNA-methyltransferase, partial [Nitrospirae bacterium]|nr:site-specific DNA-methyltransferase [Nitrospirota bacterium]
MNKLNEYDIQFIIEKLQKGEPIPEDYKYKLFPVKQKEYELVYAGKMRKEDILANEDGVFPVPLQVEKVFNGEEYPPFNSPLNKGGQKGGEWRNMIVFGDNLQFLKTVYENKDPLIKDKVKGKVKLIYIDPPFATESDFQTNKGQKAYTDKSKGADFIEFLRRRLILAREILADDGSLYVHLDWKKGHYVKTIIDEVFGEHNFRREIIWVLKGAAGYKSLANTFVRGHDTILYYSKSESPIFNKEYLPYSEEQLKRFTKDKDGRKFKTITKDKVIYLDEAKGIPVTDVWT